MRAARQRCGRPRHDDVLHLVRGARDRLLQRRQQRRRHEQRLRAAVLEHVRIVVDGQQRVDRHGHHARVQRAQERHREVDGVVQADEHALLAPDPEPRQRGGHPLDTPREFAVGERRRVVDVRDLLGAAGVAREQMCAAKLKREGGATGVPT